MARHGKLKFYLIGLTLGFCIGGLIYNGLKVGHVEIHTSKEGCEYVLKTECKQVWVSENENI